MKEARRHHPKPAPNDIAAHVMRDLGLTRNVLARTRLKPETRMQRLKRERPELFLTKEQRDAIQYAWEDELPRVDGHRNLCRGRQAPLLTDEGRAILRRESQAAASKLYRQRQAIARARKKRLDAEAAPVQPPADGQVS